MAYTYNYTSFRLGYSILRENLFYAPIHLVLEMSCLLWSISWAKVKSTSEKWSELKDWSSIPNLTTPWNILQSLWAFSQHITLFSITTADSLSSYVWKEERKKERREPSKCERTLRTAKASVLRSSTSDSITRSILGCLE